MSNKNITCYYDKEHMQLVDLSLYLSDLLGVPIRCIKQGDPSYFETHILVINTRITAIICDIILPFDTTNYTTYVISTIKKDYHELLI